MITTSLKQPRDQIFKLWHPIVEIMPYHDRPPFKTRQFSPIWELRKIYVHACMQFNSKQCISNTSTLPLHLNFSIELFLRWKLSAGTSNKYLSTVFSFRFVFWEQLYKITSHLQSAVVRSRFNFCVKLSNSRVFALTWVLRLRAAVYTW